MKTEKPILSCAGREAVSIDSALLTELLLSFTPNTIGIKEKARQLADTMRFIASGELGDENLDYFKDVITHEFLSLQLMEASKLARQSTAVTVAVDPSLDDI